MDCDARRVRAISKTLRAIANLTDETAHGKTLEANCLFEIIVQTRLSAAQTSALGAHLQAKGFDLLRVTHSPRLLSYRLLTVLSFSAVLALAVVTCWIANVKLRRGRRSMRVFLSYRVAADAELARALFVRLTEAGVDVWWDQECLPKGKPWEEGFADGLFSSTCFVALLSKAAVASFGELHAGAPCDNVLLEHRLALELHARGRIKRIFPVFIGERAGVGNDSTFGDAAPRLVLPSCQHVVVAAVERKVAHHLRRKQIRKQRLVQKQGEGAATVASVVHAIAQSQGELVSGVADAAISRLVASIEKMVEEVRAEQQAALSTDASADTAGRPSGKSAVGPSTASLRSLHRPWALCWLRRSPVAPRLLREHEASQRASKRPECPMTDREEVEMEVAPLERRRLDGYFTSNVHEDSRDHFVLNPLMLHKAKEVDDANTSRSGGLARLNGMVKSEERVVDVYLQRHEKVQKGARHSRVDAARLAAKLEVRRANNSLTEQEISRRASQVVRAREQQGV
jgi:hypothetical protein